MRKIITAIGAGLLGYAITKRIRSDREDFDWDYEEETDEDITEPLPMFFEGDSVILYNPYDDEFFSRKWALYDPERYVITNIDYDRQEGVFRYLLKDGGTDADGHDLWYSEDWLSLPPKTAFVTKRIPIAKVETVTPEMSEAERRILEKALDDDLREREIDRLLDRLKWAIDNGTDEEIAEYKRQLRKLTERK